ncbi:MAG: hypothetical protein PHQ34_13830 [Methanothrix sp.]|nr:hypothetical protein [Methanothrix sp.]
MTVVTITDTSPVVTVTDSAKRITIDPPSEIRVDIGVNPPVFNLTGHSIFAKAGIGGVNGFQIVFLGPDGMVYPADGENPTHAGLVIGMASAAIAEGENGLIQMAGEIENPAWSLVPGATYYLGAAGTMSTTLPENGFWQKIGVAKDSATLVLSLGEPIKLV